MWPAAVHRLFRSSFARFCVVGGAGFVTDTAVLLGLVRLAGLPPIPTKVLSFAVALLVTFWLNRSGSFSAVRRGSAARAFAAYLSVQSTGAACNLAVFAACTAYLPRTLPWLGAAAALAALAGLMVNYVGASRFVFLPHRGSPD